MNRHTCQRALLMVAAAAILQGCALSERYRLERETAMAEKRERYAYERQAREESSRGAWSCTSGGKRAQEDFPWLHCSCTDNRRSLR